MERAEAERKILRHMEAIREIMREYAPDDPYITAYVSTGGTISFHNAYWLLPPERRIDFYQANEEVSE